MKKILLTVYLFILIIPAFCKTWIISASGSSFVFSPDAITITAGDSVKFIIDNIHNALEVSQATWNSNGSSSNGGFAVPYGGGLLLPAQLAAGIHYYVCQNHASMGMKGSITVQNPTASAGSSVNSKIQTRAFPNPFSNKITIETASADAIVIYNLLGEKISVTTVKNNETRIDIDTNDLPKGLYFYSVVKGGITMESRKITKR